jgi:hypothetical protein
MTEDRKYAILFAATLLCARKLIELDSDRPSPAKVAAVENAISQAAFIWSAKTGSGRREVTLPQIARDESLSSNDAPIPYLSGGRRSFWSA